ncbi:hypothetical protein ABK040_003607 [Willaertia magna]
MNFNNNTSIAVCVFEFQNENFHSNNKNENLKTDFKEIETVKSLCNGSDNLLYVTTNNKGYQLLQKKFISCCLNQENIIDVNDNYIIDVTDNYGNINVLTRNKVYLNSFSRSCIVDLPEIDFDDKFIKLATGAKNFAFLLTEKGKVFIYGENVSGVFGCDISSDNLIEFERLTKLDKLESKIVEIKCGFNFCVIKCENGDSYGSGYNCFRNKSNLFEFREFTLLEQLKGKVKQFDCGCLHTIYLTKIYFSFFLELITRIIKFSSCHSIPFI